MYASHSRSMYSDSVVQEKKTPLILAAENNKSAQASAIVERLLKGKADVDARDSVSPWEGGVVWSDHIYG